jgi:hypothetical protein
MPQAVVANPDEVTEFFLVYLIFLAAPWSWRLLSLQQKLILEDISEGKRETGA